VLIPAYKIFIQKNYPFSLYKIFFFFIFFFFGIAPLIEFKYVVSFFGMGVIPADEYVFAYITLIPFFIIYDIIYNIVRKKKTRLGDKLYKIFDHSPSIVNNKYRFSKKSTIAIILLIILSLLITLDYNQYSFINLLVRGGEDISRTEMEKSFALIINIFVRPICIIFFLYYSLLGSSRYLRWFLFFMAIIITAPTGMPRFLAAALYIPILLISFKFFRKENSLMYVLVGGLLFVFPFLNQFRFYSSGGEHHFGFVFEMFTSGDFDSFSTYVRIVNADFITWGEQFKGALLFFVPRSIWPDKPLSSGMFYADNFNAIYDNLAVNYFAEGYLNFGFIGVLFFTVLLAYYCALFDKIYWTKSLLTNKNGFTVLYFISLGLLVFLLRGDLMNGFAYTTGLFLCVFFINFLLKRKNVSKCSRFCKEYNLGKSLRKLLN
jgi:oligosaccharide repeat unit polymerase